MKHHIVLLAGGVGAAVAGLASCAVHAVPLVMVGAALAQSADPLGISTPSTAELLVTAAIAVVAGFGVIYGLLRMAVPPGHPIAGLALVCVAVLGIAKAGMLAALLLRGLGVVLG